MGDDIKAVDYLNKAVALGKDTASENLSTFLVNLGKITKSIGFINEEYSAQWIFDIFSAFVKIQSTHCYALYWVLFKLP